MIQPTAHRRLGLGLLVTLLCALAVVRATGQDAPEPDAASPPALTPEVGASIKVKLQGADEKVGVAQMPDGSMRFVLRTDDGDVLLAPEAFAERVFAEQAERPWWMRLLNITSVFGVAWFAIGLFGQLLFTGRMLVQWLVSEKRKASTVPVAFWWLSLGGASMLITYFIWRKDIVGILGQSMGWTIYTRNLWLIYAGRKGEEPTIDQDPAPEPELDG